MSMEIKKANLFYLVSPCLKLLNHLYDVFFDLWEPLVTNASGTIQDEDDISNSSAPFIESN